MAKLEVEEIDLHRVVRQAFNDGFRLCEEQGADVPQEVVEETYAETLKRFKIKPLAFEVKN